MLHTKEQHKQGPSSPASSCLAAPAFPLPLLDAPANTEELGAVKGSWLACARAFPALAKSSAAALLLAILFSLLLATSCRRRGLRLLLLLPPVMAMCFAMLRCQQSMVTAHAGSRRLRGALELAAEPLLHACHQRDGLQNNGEEEGSILLRA